jgi:hypothetical protein
VIALLLGCGPGEDPAKPVPAEPECPPVAWVVWVSALLNERIDQVIALPGGDVLVSGYAASGGIPLGTGPDDVVNHVAGAGRILARLDTQGRMRWGHGVGDGTRVRTSIGLTKRTVWIVGQETSGPVQLDLESLDTPSDPNGEDDAFLIEFDLETGAMGRWRYLGGLGYQEAKAVGEDDSGNLYATGFYRSGPLDLGSGFVLPSPPPDDPGDWAWLASWDRAGTVRWVIGAPFAKGEGLSVSGAQVLWNVHGGALQSWLRPGQDAVPFEGPPTTASQVIYPIDPATGTPLAPRMDLVAVNTDWSEFGLDSAGSVSLTGKVVPPGHWVGSSGDREEFSAGLGAVQATLTDGGELESLVELPSYFGNGGDTATLAFSASSGSSDGVELNPGTPSAFVLDPSGVGESMAGWRRDDGIIDCAWAIQGDATDAVRDAAGGFVVVGAFTGRTEIRDRNDEVVHVFDRSSISGDSDGFIIRFAWPDDAQ